MALIRELTFAEEYVLFRHGQLKHNIEIMLITKSSAL